MITYAKETNIAATTSYQIENKFTELFRSNPSTALAQRIIKGVTKFIPKLSQAKFVKIDYGIIQTLLDQDTIDFGFQIGDLDFIHDPLHGGITKRDYSGVKVMQEGYIINSCMKLIYCQHNAEIVRSLLSNNEHFVSKDEGR